MTNKSANKQEIDILMEEYKQVYEFARHHNNIASNKEAIFAVAAFGVLAFALNKDLRLLQAVGAAFVSLALYIYHVLAFNRMSFFGEVNFVRLREIENSINKLSDSNKKILCFQTNYHDYKLEAQKNHCKWIPIRCMQWVLVGILLFLWGIVIGTKISHSFFYKNVCEIHKKVESVKEYPERTKEAGHLQLPKDLK